MGVPYVVEYYGIIYNKGTCFKKYTELPGAKIKDAKEINSFDKLKEVSDDMQAKDSSASRAPSPPQASTPAPTGVSRPTWRTSRSPMSSRRTV